jgi:hypothetical protein
VTVGWAIMIILSIASTARVLMIPADDPDERGYCNHTPCSAKSNTADTVRYRTFFVSTIRSTDALP